jgi:hypothetical protein
MNESVISARTIGNVAFETLQSTHRGKVTGLVSSGIYLRTDDEWLLFLSYAEWRGPLTINLSTTDRGKLAVELHSSFLIQHGTVLFQAEGSAIKFDHAIPWSPSLKPVGLLSPEERIARYSRVKEQVTSALNRRLTPNNGRGSLSGPLSAVDLADQSLLRIAVDEKRSGDILAALVAGLGSGTGLTPTGDDLAQGFLLALNRWGEQLCPDLPARLINPELVAAARHRTTALSASLINCAARGLADERLVSALDGLVSGDLAEDRIMEYLLAWGHSSGVAALQGMGLLVA